jgi:hypothetical protein
MHLVKLFAVAGIFLQNCLATTSGHHGMYNITPHPKRKKRMYSDATAKDFFIGDNNTNSTNQPHFTFDQMWNLQKKFMDNFMYPANVEQAKMINSSLMAPNVILPLLLMYKLFVQF